MNKNFKKFAVMALAGLTLCGTAMAAPRGGRNPAPKPAPIQHRTPAPVQHKTPAPVQHKTPAPVQHHTPAHRPAPIHHTTVQHVHHDNDTGLIALGAVAIGAVVGAIFGACN